MNLTLFAKALGVGVEKAALLSYSDACMFIGGNDYAETVHGEDLDDWVQMRIAAYQALTDHLGECVELVITVTDGLKEMKAYFYSRQVIPNID